MEQYRDYMKKIAVVIKNGNLGQGIEALRIGLGASLARGVEVTVALYGDGVYLLAGGEPALAGCPDPAQSFELLEASNVPILADALAVRERGISGAPGAAVLAERGELLNKVMSADFIMTF